MLINPLFFLDWPVSVESAEYLYLSVIYFKIDISISILNWVIYNIYEIKQLYVLI